MAFEKYTIVSSELREDSGGQPNGHVVRGYITDTARPGEKHRFDFCIEGEEFDELSDDPETREYQIRGISKRQVAQHHAAWLAASPPPPAFTSQSPAEIGGDILDLDDAAPAYNPETGWGGWGAPGGGEGSAPTFVSAVLGASGEYVVVTFSGPDSPGGLRFDAGVEITVIGGQMGLDSGFQPGGVGPNGVRYVLVQPVEPGLPMTWSYNAAVGDLQSPEGVHVESITPQSVDTGGGEGDGGGELPTEE